jgi:Mg-chelatase subunit ChlD
MRVSQLAALLFVLGISPTVIYRQLPIQKPSQPSEPAQSSTRKDEQEQDKSQIVSVDTTDVVLHLTVTDGNGKFISKLTAEDFEVLEDRVPQHVLSLSSYELPFAAAILLDTSGSMDSKMSLARAACTGFVEGIRDGDVFAIYGFGGTKVKLLQDFTEVRDAGFALWDEDARGMTPLYDGIVEASQALGKRGERRKAILLVSDGADTQSKATFEKALRQAMAFDISIYCVDLTDPTLNRTNAANPGGEAMKNFSLKTGGRFFRTPGGAALKSAFIDTVQELRNQYTLIYEPLNEKRDGKWRSIEVRPRRLNVNVRTRQGYFAKK